MTQPGAAPQQGVARLVAAGLAGVWLQQATWIETVRLYRGAGLLVVSTGLGAGLDTVVVDGDGGGLSDPGTALDSAAAALAAHGSELWLDLVDGAHPALEAAAAARGLGPVLARTVMTRSLTAGDVSPGDASAGDGARAQGAGAHGAAGDAVGADAAAGGVSAPDAEPAALLRSVKPAIAPEIGLAGVADLETLRDLYASCFGMPPEVAAGMVNPQALGRGDVARLLWREPGGRAAAMATAHLLGSTVGIFGVATRPAARRRGIAGSLVGAAVALGRARGAELAWLLADAGATGAYRAAGFDAVGLQHGWTVPTPGR